MSGAAPWETPAVEVLPSGTVTFLFTDIESSSAQWETEPERMAAMLARHDEILAAVIKDAGGRVFKHLGDGMCAVFDSAPSAVTAAVTAMMALEAEVWPAAQALRVRMGLHTGLSTPVGGDYFGPPVNRAARVMNAANSGQIVCSSATVALCPDRAFRDAGRHELAGLGDERLFIVAGVGSSEDRPLRSTNTVPTNIVRSTSRFVGRDEELRRLTNNIEPRRLITLVGPGGVGKTRLATETALEVAPRFTDGVWLCELATVLDGDPVAATVADTIGARHQAGMDLMEAIAAYLQRRQCLVVLDNCEHVLNAVVRLARRLLALEGVAVLATSREVLGVDDEQLWPVPPLQEQAATELFIDRCRHRNPNFSIEGEAAETVRQISRRLDGIPLALELAAGRTTALSPRAIEQRLSDRFRMLRGGRRGERHQTMRDTVQWSYDLLSPAEAALFDRLCVFAGGFTVDAAEAVCSDQALVDEPDVLDLLVALVDKSMVQRDRTGKDRFVMLETLRQFGEEQLHGTGEAAAFRDRHFHYFRRVAADLDRGMFGPDEPEVWGRFDAEWDNLRMAVAHARAARDVEGAAAVVLASYFYGVMAMRYEVGDWAAGLLADGAGLSITTTARLRGVRSWAAWSTGDVTLAVELFDAAEADGTLEPTFFFTTIVGFLQLDDLPRAARAAVALMSAAQRDDPRDRHAAVAAQPYYLAAAGDTQTALHWANEAVAIATRAGSPSALAHALHVRGIAHNRDPELAIADSRRALELALSVDATHVIADGALGQLAAASAYLDDFPEALRNSRAAIVSAASAHYLGSLNGALQSTAVVLARLGDAEVAARLLRCTRRYGFRVGRRVERVVESILGRDYCNDVDGGTLDMLDAAQLALDSIDGHLSNRVAPGNISR
jgi:predicted ATPase/class 3 adenylate cyclase